MFFGALNRRRKGARGRRRRTKKHFTILVLPKLSYAAILCFRLICIALPPPLPSFLSFSPPKRVTACYIPRTSSPSSSPPILSFCLGSIRSLFSFVSFFGQNAYALSHKNLLVVIGLRSVVFIAFAAAAQDQSTIRHVRHSKYGGKQCVQEKIYKYFFSSNFLRGKA